MANILQCNVFLTIVRHVVMERALDPRSRSFTESHLQKVNMNQLNYICICLLIYVMISRCCIYWALPYKRSLAAIIRSLLSTSAHCNLEF